MGGLRGEHNTILIDAVCACINIDTAPTKRECPEGPDKKTALGPIGPNAVNFPVRTNEMSELLVQ